MGVIVGLRDGGGNSRNGRVGGAGARAADSRSSKRPRARVAGILTSGNNTRARRLEDRMENPFPGMDPYMEQQWGDAHHAIITYARDQLSPHLPPALLARIGERVFVEFTP